MAADLRSLAYEDFCYLTIVGRVTGRPHVIEIWFALGDEGRSLYMLSGGRDRSDWVKNLRRNPKVTVRVAGESFEGRARVVEREKGRMPWRAGYSSRSTRAIRAALRTGDAPPCRSPWIWWFSPAASSTVSGLRVW